MPRPVAAIIPAAGQGLRMGQKSAKQFLALGGMPILTRSCLAVKRSAVADHLVVVAPPGQEADVVSRCLEPYGLAGEVEVVAGGAQRQDSVANGVARALELGAGWLVVHDGVRPLAPPELFGQVLAQAREHGAAIAAAPCVDTVKEAGEDALVAATRDRGRLWLVQTPQAFEAGLLVRALERAAREGYTATDEAGLVERMGHPVKLVPGPRHNLKITTPEDLQLAQGWLGNGELRVGQGLDVHRLVAGRPLILGGVRIEHELGLLGHSDADALTHAIMDALLAAAGLGDIGAHFPDSDPAYKDADSLGLLVQVMDLLAGAGFAPCQVSATLAAQRPKLGPHFPAMRANLARVLRIAPEMVNLAATTTEGLGFVGREEGVAALASATLVCLELEGKR